MQKRRVLTINLGNFGSTGTIAKNINSVAKNNGLETFFAYPETSLNKPKEENDIIICSEFSNKFNKALAFFTGCIGCFSHLNTKLLLKKISKISPDIIHLHNIHNSYINHGMLFKYIKKHKIPVVWTLHDCWSFTGQCAYFTIAGCEKWKNGCSACTQINRYPSTFVDRTKKMYNLKKKWFQGVDNLTVVTPSQWLADLVKQSFLKEYPVKVINNGINLEVFKPTESDFRKKYNCEEKFIVLGVAFGWGERKGLDVFIELSKLLDEKFQIVLVGTDANIDKQLPDNIISIHRTQNQKELAEIYSAADLFFNPTREENYPTVNMESIACGTPVLTFDTGGSGEIPDEVTGKTLAENNLNQVLKEIENIQTNNYYTEEACLKRREYFDTSGMCNNYLKLYEDIIGERI